MTSNWRDILASTSPSSYASEVTVLDQKEEFHYRIFMNNVLDYKGIQILSSQL